MLNVSPELYEIISLAMRYVFAFLGILIVLRTYRWLLSDRRARRSRLGNMPESGAVGELIVLQGGPDFPPDTYLPVPREGTLGSSRGCDLTIPCPGVRHEHLSFRWEDGNGLLLDPVRGSRVNIQSNAVSSDPVPRKMVLRHGDQLTIGEVVLVFQVYVGLRGGTVLQSQTFPPMLRPFSGPAVTPSSDLSDAEWTDAPRTAADSSALSPVPVAIPDLHAPETDHQPNLSSSIMEQSTIRNMNPEIAHDAIPDVSGHADAPTAASMSDASQDWSRYRRPKRSDRWKEDWSE